MQSFLLHHQKSLSIYHAETYLVKTMLKYDKWLTEEISPVHKPLNKILLFHSQQRLPTFITQCRPEIHKSVARKPCSVQSTCFPGSMSSSIIRHSLAYPTSTSPTTSIGVKQFTFPFPSTCTVKDLNKMVC